MTDEIRVAIEGASAYLAAHPDEARYTDSPATATLEGGLRVRVGGSSGEELMTDMPAAVGGGGGVPGPGWLLRAAVAACVTSLAAMRAAQIGVDGFGCQVEVDSESDDRGILGIGDGVPAGPLSMRIGLRLSGGDPDVLREVAAWAVEHCPVSDAVHRAVPVRVEVDVA